MRGMFGFPHAARLRGGGRDGGSQGGNEIVMAEESSEEEESSEITRILGKDDGGARGRRRWDDDEGMVVEQGPFAAKRGFGEEEGPMLGKRGFDDEDDPQALPNEDETTSADLDDLRATGGFWVDTNGRRHRGVPELGKSVERVSRRGHEDTSHASQDETEGGGEGCEVQPDWSSDAIRTEVHTWADKADPVRGEPVGQVSPAWEPSLLHYDKRDPPAHAQEKEGNEPEHAWATRPARSGHGTPPNAPEGFEGAPAEGGGEGGEAGVGEEGKDGGEDDGTQLDMEWVPADRTNEDTLWKGEPGDFTQQELRLAEACSAGNVGEADLAIKAGACLNTTCYGQPPLHFAVEGGFGDLVELLLDAGASIEERALMPQSMPLGSALHRAVLEGNLPIVQLLLSRGADPSARDSMNATCLHAAAREGHEHLIDTLLADERSDVAARDKYGRTPLHDAVFGGHTKAAAALVARASNVFAEDCDLKAALAYAPAPHQARSKGGRKGRARLQKLLVAAQTTPAAMGGRPRPPPPLFEDDPDEMMGEERARGLGVITCPVEEEEEDDEEEDGEEDPTTSMSWEGDWGEFQGASKAAAGIQAIGEEMAGGAETAPMAEGAQTDAGTVRDRGAHPGKQLGGRVLV